MAEGAQRLASLIVLGGPLKGRRHDLEEVVTEVLIGADESCHLTVDLPTISPIHARLWSDLNVVTIYDTRAPRGLYVNDTRVQGEAQVKDGDVIWLGAPDEAESVGVQCHFEPWVEVLPGADAVAEGEGVPAPSPEESEAPAAPAVPLDAYETAMIDPEPGLDSAEPLGVAPEPEPPASAAPPEPPPPPPLAPSTPPAAAEPAAPAPAAPPPAPEEVSLLVGEEPEEFQPGVPLPDPGGPTAPPVAPSPIEATPPPPAPAESGTPPAEPAPPPAPPPPPVPEEPAPPSPPPAPEESAPPSPPPAPEESAPPPPPAEPSAAEDPFFVGDLAPAESPSVPPAEGAQVDSEWSVTEAAPTPAAPPAAPPAPEAPPGAPLAEAGDDAFFIAEESLTLGPPTATPPSPAAAPSDPMVAEEVVMEAEVVEAEPVPAPPSPPPAAPPPPAEAEGGGRARLPPSQQSPGGAPDSTPAADAPPPGPAGQPEPPAEAPAPTRRPPTPARVRPAAAGRRARPAGGRRPARRRPAGGSEWVRPVGYGALAALVVAAIGVGVMGWLGAAPKVLQVSPSRVRVGQRATVTGSGFSDETTGISVLFGSAAATVVSASSTQLEVEVPEAVVEAGAERRVPVVVKKGNRESEPIEVSVFAGPNLHGLSPDVAMPGEAVVLAGAGWGLGATVRFGDLAAEVLEASPTQIRVVVPALPGVSGTPAPVVVTVGGVDSNPAPFYVGRLPLITSVAPTTASMGDVLTVSGRGFQREPLQNEARIAGIRALVVSAFDDELQVVVPRLGPGEPARPLEVRVPGSEEIGRAIIQVAPAPDPLELRFVAEPFPGPPERPHAVVSTGLGPAFVLSAANGRSAAQRALAAQQGLNEATNTLAAAPGLLPEARDLTTKPVVGLSGRGEVLLEATEADAAAYNEDWTRLRGRGGPVTPARLARWWEAEYRDLVLLLLRGDRPSFAAALAPEGRVLQQLHDAAQRAGGPGVSQQVVAGARSSVRNGLRVVALRVPASVTAAAPPAPTSTTTAAAATPTPAPRVEPLSLEGTWTGSESEAGRRRYLTVTFRRTEGTISYEGGITLTVPFLSYDKLGRDGVRFAVQIRGGMRHYHGQWDGETLSGNLTKDQAGSNVVGTFELRPR